MAHLHVIWMVHDILNHILEDVVAREYRIQLGVGILRLERKESALWSYFST